MQSDALGGFCEVQFDSHCTIERVGFQVGFEFEVISLGAGGGGEEDAAVLFGCHCSD